MAVEIGDALPLLGASLGLVLLLPKHGARAITTHLRETAHGRRHYAFGPPFSSGPLAHDVIERWFQLVRREWPRLIDLGVALYVIAVLVESRGAARRLARESEWRESPLSLLLDHLVERTPESAYVDQLRIRGFLEPAPKLTVTTPSPVIAPPLRWRLEWEQERAALANDPAPPERVEARPAAPNTAERKVCTLGEIRLRVQGVDFAPRLLRKPILGFLWTYLVARYARRPGDRTSRGDIGDEVYPAIDPEVQRDRTRRRLSELVAELPESFRECVRMEGDFVWLDLSGCSFDVPRLLELARRVERQPEHLTDDQIEEIRANLDLAGQEFLPGWEGIEHRATAGRGAAGEIVAQVRAEVAAAHASLLRTLADRCIAHRQPERAIPDLEAGLRARPDQVTIAVKLAAAYEQAGQVELATRLRQRYDIVEAS